MFRRAGAGLVLIGLTLGGSAGCDSGRSTANRPAASRSGLADPAVARARGSVEAKAAAETEFGLVAGGDYSGAWALWTDEAKAVVSRDEYVAASTACRPGFAVATRIITAEPIDGAHVRVDWARGTRTGSADMVLIGGTWRYQPDQATLGTYRAGAACPPS